MTAGPTTSGNSLIMNLRHTFSYLLMISLSASLMADNIRLANPDWLSSPEKRSLLYFITQCALGREQMLSVENHGVIFEFYGQLGAGPGWNGYANSLTEQQQRWVSACVLARVNYFATPVPINMRTAAGSQGLVIDAGRRELEDYPFFEGGFFGNIFVSPAKKYVCTGDTAPQILIGKNRICTLPSIASPRISECGFVIIGSCENEYLFERDEIIYQEIIYTYLPLH